MPSNWELRIHRSGEQRRNDRCRTVGTYQVFHDAKPLAGLSGACAETRGPGDNGHTGNNRCIEAGSYSISTQDGSKYCTIGYTTNTNPAALRRPALLLTGTDHRVGILLRQGRRFLSSVGCINPCSALADVAANIDFTDSRIRVIAIIDDLAAFLAGAFPSANGRPIPNAKVLIA